MTGKILKWQLEKQAPKVLFTVPSPKVKHFTDTDEHQWEVSFEFIDFSDEWLQQKTAKVKKYAN